MRNCISRKYFWSFLKKSDKLNLIVSCNGQSLISIFTIALSLMLRRHVLSQIEKPSYFKNYLDFFFRGFLKVSKLAFSDHKNSWSTFIFSHLLALEKGNLVLTKSNDFSRLHCLYELFTRHRAKILWTLPECNLILCRGLAQQLNINIFVIT